MTGKRMVHGFNIEEDTGSEDMGIDKPGKSEKVQLEDLVVKLKDYMKH